MKSKRLPFLSWIPDNARNHFVAMSGEFAGTTLFLFFAFSGTQVALLCDSENGVNVIGEISNPAQLLYIALSFGFSLAVNAWVFFRISGGLFNPAVTLGMCIVGVIPYVRGCLLAFSQILGGVTAAAICSALLPGPLMVRTRLGGGTTLVQGLFIEMFLTAELVFTIFMLAAEKHKGTFIAPIGIGLSLFIAQLTGVYFTGGSLNPARSFGPAVVSHQFNTYHWIYWVGPILGSLLAAGFYKFIKMLEYETANPNQDATVESERLDPDAVHNNKAVPFVPEDYAERGMAGKANTVVSATNEKPPWSDSPTIATPSAGLSGPRDSVAHDDDLIEPRSGEQPAPLPSRESNESTVATLHNSNSNSGGVSRSTQAASYASRGGRNRSASMSVVGGVNPALSRKGSMKPGTNIMTGRPASRSVSDNTWSNRLAEHTGFDKEGNYEKK